MKYERKVYFLLHTIERHKSTNKWGGVLIMLLLEENGGNYSIILFIFSPYFYETIL